MRNDEGKAKARQAVVAAMASRQWNPADLWKHAGVDAGTVGDFLSGARWPKIRTQARIEEALGWPAGTLNQYAIGVTPELGGQQPHAGPELDDLTDEEAAVLEATLTAMRGTSGRWRGRFRTQRQTALTAPTNVPADLVDVIEGLSISQEDKDAIYSSVTGRPVVRGEAPPADSGVRDRRAQ